MILFVDDEFKRVQAYLEELQYHYEVHYEERADNAFHFFEQSATKITLIILDIMMPHSGRFDRNETDSGMKSGLVFYRRIRESAPDLPVIILTNYNRPEIEEEFRREANCWYLQKKHYSPRELVDIVRHCLDEIPVIG